MAQTKHKKKIAKKRAARRLGLGGATAALVVLFLVVAGIAYANTPPVTVVRADPASSIPKSTPQPTPTPAPSPTATATPVPVRTAVPAATQQPLSYPLPRYVAHEGGMYLGKTYTNSIASLDNSYLHGYRLIEVDLNLTTDGQVVLLHDWGPTMVNVFGIAEGQRDLQTLLSETAKTTHHAAQLSDLAAWLHAHPAARVVLDSKTDAVDMLTRVASRYPELRAQLNPYIDNFEQFQPVSNMGFTHISLLTGPGQYTPGELLAFARTHRLYFMAMQAATLATQLPQLSHTVAIFCWTINSSAERNRLFGIGAWGVITDTLGP